MRFHCAATIKLKIFIEPSELTGLLTVTLVFSKLMTHCTPDLSTFTPVVLFCGFFHFKISGLKVFLSTTPY